MLAGAVRGERSRLHLLEQATDEALRADCGGRVASVWQHGPDDRVEVAAVEERR